MSSVANTGGPPASVTQSAVPAGQTLKQTKVGEGDDETTITQFGTQSLGTQTALNEAANKQQRLKQLVQKIDYQLR